MIIKEFTSVSQLPTAANFYGFAKVPGLNGTQNIFYSDGATWWMLGGAKGDITNIVYDGGNKLSSWVEGGVTFTRTHDANDRTLTVAYDDKLVTFTYTSGKFMGITVA